MEDTSGYIPPPTGPANEKTTLTVRLKVTKIVTKEKTSPSKTQQGKHTSTRKNKGRAVTPSEPTPLVEDLRQGT